MLQEVAGARTPSLKENVGREEGRVPKLNVSGIRATNPSMTVSKPGALLDVVKENSAQA